MIWAEWGTSQTPVMNQNLFDWASYHIWGDHRGFNSGLPMAVMEEKEGEEPKIIAVVVAHNYDPGAGIIELSGASIDKRWLTKPVIRRMYGYCFDDVGVQLVVQRISDRDRAMWKIFKSMGYDLHHIPRLRGRDHGEFVGTFTEEAWRSNRFAPVAVPQVDEESADVLPATTSHIPRTPRGRDGQAESADPS